MGLAKGAKRGFPGEFLEAQIAGSDGFCFSHDHPPSREDIFAKLGHWLTQLQV
jgi:hypothetical protein